jgi:AcrR family transcriptional regulator
MRLKPGTRRTGILFAAVSVAARVGYLNVTRDAVAQAANISTGLVTHYFKSMDGLRREIMVQAIESQILPIVREGIANRDPEVAKIDKELHDKAMRC